MQKLVWVTSWSSFHRRLNNEKVLIHSDDSRADIDFILLLSRYKKGTRW